MAVALQPCACAAHVLYFACKLPFNIKKHEGFYNEHTSTARDNAKKANPYAAWHDKKSG